MTGLKRDSPVMVSSPSRGASVPGSSPHKPPLPQDLSLPEVTVPDASLEKEREPLLAAANEAVAAPAEELLPSAVSPGECCHGRRC